MGSIFELPEFKAHQAGFEAKQRKLFKRRAYYDGSVYEKIGKQLRWLAPKLGKDIKPLFLPLSRAVDIDAGIVPGGWTFEGEDADMANPEWVQARDALFKASRWNIWGVLYVHYGAQYGVSAIKLVQTGDDITISPVDPANLYLTYARAVDLVPEMSLWVETKRDSENKDIEYAEVITENEIRIYYDGQEIEVEGIPDVNPLGFVPYVEIRHIETGEEWGESTFEKAMTLLDEVNALAGKLSKIIEDHGDPQWAVFGAQPSALTHSGDNVWFFPEGAEAKIMIPEIDIEGVLEFIREIKAGVKEALPELGFDELRSKEQIAAETLGLQLLELVIKVQRARPNYDAGLVMIMQLAGRVSATYKALDDDSLALDEDRPILPLDPMTKIKIEQAQLTLEMMKGPDVGSE